MINTTKQLVSLAVMAFLIASCGVVTRFTAPESLPPEKPAEPKTQAERKRPFEDSFQRVRTKTPEFVKNKKTPQSYYVRLRSEALRVPSEHECVDDSVLSLLRQFFVGQEAGEVALIAKVRAPGGSLTISSPLYVSTINEDQGRCRTYVVNRSITPYSIVGPNESFDLDMSIRWAKKADMYLAKSLMNAVRILSPLTDANTNILSAIAPEIVGKATSAIDDSLSQHETVESLHDISLAIKTYPRDGNWSDYKGGIEFNAASLIATPLGVEVKPENVPSVRISPEYLESFFALNGKYMNSDRILAHRLGSTEDHTLKSFLSEEIDGVRIADAMRIENSDALANLCVNLPSVLAGYFTDDDALAVRFAVLRFYTEYLNLRALRRPSCLNESEKDRLLQMNATFIVLDLTRRTEQDRKQRVESLMHPITTALRRQERDEFVSLLEDVNSFSLHISDQQAFPEQEKWSSHLSGESAVDQLMSTVIRSGCYEASPQQNLNTIAMVSLPNGGNSTGTLAVFNDRDKLQELSFVPTDRVRKWFDPEFAGENCALL